MLLPAGRRCWAGHRPGCTWPGTRKSTAQPGVDRGDGRVRVAGHRDGHTFFKLKRGQLLPGFSGSPLLDLRRQAVAAVAESSRGPARSWAGSRCPPRLAAAFPAVASANQAFHASDNRWGDAAEAERVLAAERAEAGPGCRCGPPWSNWSRDEDVSAATSLRPRHAVVGYVGRDQLLGELAEWCEREPQDGESAGLWFVTGGGGFGKTRLAVEACREAEARGWTAGLLPPGATEASCGNWRSGRAGC